MRGPWDVIVVGGGGSGLAAAVSAAERGLKVLVLEKNPQPGGTTGIAIGSFTSNRTSLQEKAGIEDSLDEHQHDAGLFAPPEIEARNCGEMRAWFLSESAETYKWLMKLGLTFHGPSPEPPNRRPRMHNVIPNAKAYITTLSSRLRKRGGRIQCGASVKKLLINKEGIGGVAVEIDGQPVEYEARLGVILATGDYANSPEILSRFKGEKFAEIEGINKTATGEGHLLAEEAGGQLVNMDVTYGPEIRFVPPPNRGLNGWASTRIGRRLAAMVSPFVPDFVQRAVIKRLLVTWQHPEDSLFDDGAIFINQQGERFCDETKSPQREIALARQPEKIGYILLDERLIDLYAQWPKFVSTAPEIAYAYVKDYLKLRPDVACRGKSLAEIAEKRNISRFHLERTVDDFNRAVDDNPHHTDPWGHAEDSPPLGGRRWVLLGPAKAYFTTTEGGTRVNRQLQVLDAADKPIPGLYAVGQVGLSGQVLWGHGLHIAWALTSGRIAGKSIGVTESA